jgi:heat shock protein 1/8
MAPKSNSHDAKSKERRKKMMSKMMGQDDSGSDGEGAAFAPPARVPPDEMSKMAAQKLKDEGNAAFTAGNWLNALGLFTRAIEMDYTDHVFYSNRSGANLKLLRTRDAVTDANQCIALKPNWAKGYSRLGAALLADMQPEEAVQAFKKGLNMDPKNEVMIEGLKDATAAAEEEKKRLAEEEKEEEAAAAPAYNPEDSVVIGIDLGTTFSCVAVWKGGGVEILEDDGGNRTTPSFVAFTPDGARLVGEAAKSQAARNPKNTLYDIKRILGQKMGEHAVRDEVKRFPFEIVADKETDDPRIKVEALNGKLMPPEQVSGLVLAHMKRIAEARLGHPVKKAVVTVPAYFNDAQRTATKSAGTIAGLDVLRIINEPTAAALAYGLDKKEGAEEGKTMEGANVLIYDLGGGTFDVSVLRIEEGMFQVLATGGDTHLGGEDFDNSVVEHFCTVLKDKVKDLKSDDKLMRKLRTAVEKAKRTLSSGNSAQVEFEDHSLELSREKFESLNKAIFERTFDTVKKVLKDAKLENKDIDDVVLIGGSTRIPKIQEALSAAFGGRQLCRSINPDEAVAYGAAVQGAILSGVRNAACDALVLLDVTPRSLGIEVQGKKFSVIIPKNSSIPCKKSDGYTTTVDYQPSIEVCVYEGENPQITGNRLLGEFSVSNIERAKQGEPQVEVSFALDANGILDVSAVDKKTRAKAECRIQGACQALDAATLAKMAAETDEFAAEDVEYKEQAEMRQQLEDLAYDLQDSKDPTTKQKSEDCLDFLETIGSLGKAPVRKNLEKWLEDLRALK